MTNKEMFEQIKGKLTDAEEIAFIETQIAALDRKAAKAKERAAKKKVAGDELRETIFSVLTDEFQTLDMILPAVKEITGDDTLTNSKIIPRLSALVDLEKVVKEKVKTDNGDKMAYAIATEGAFEN